MDKIIKDIVLKEIEAKMKITHKLCIEARTQRNTTYYGDMFAELDSLKELFIKYIKY